MADVIVGACVCHSGESVLFPQDPSYSLSGVRDDPVVLAELEEWFLTFRRQVTRV